MEKKAVINTHSDKTKDMPQEGLIVFTTFYDSIFNKKGYQYDGYDITCQRIQRGVDFLSTFIQIENLTQEFSVPLYPNSVFAIPLSTNRLYTH